MKLIYDPITKTYKEEYLEETADEKVENVIPYQDQMRIRKLYGGFPIYDTSSGLNPKVGEIYLIKCGSMRLCARFEGITSSVSLS
jgi:hypothetical protein